MTDFSNGGKAATVRRSKNIAVLALMLALTVFFCFVPITFPGGVTLAFMIFPLLIVAQGYDIKMTAILAVMMALVNQLAWYTTKAGQLMAPVWQNPLVCMVPRIMIGIVSYYMGYGLRKAFLRPKYVIDEKGEKRLVNKNQLYAKDFAISAACTAVGVFTNTALCGLFAVLCYNGKVLSENTMISIEFILTWFSINFVIEIISFSILVPPIVMALRKASLIPAPVLGKEVITEDRSQNASDKEDGNEADEPVKEGETELSDNADIDLEEHSSTEDNSKTSDIKKDK